jgi:hypothetical protein
MIYDMQKVDLYQPIVTEKVGPPPLTLRVGVTTSNGYIEGGTPSSYMKPETYVLLSALPEELRQRVVTAVQAILSSM